MTPREYLFSLEGHGIKLGLENITRLLESAGRPHRTYPTVHVAGTNGKGSVVALLDAMLSAAGYRIGRFTSPHLLSVCERFLLNSAPISEEELDEHLAFFQSAAADMENPPTFFEVVTAVAFRWFAQREVDVALVEVGMGGRFDSTNVVVPEVSAITNIALEHTRYLGDTLEEIAFEKAGIIKRGVPVVVGVQEEGPREVIRARAAELDSPARFLGRDFSYALSGPPYAHRFRFDSPGLSFGPVPLALPGTYQGDNAAVAVATADLLRHRFPRLDRDAIVAGLGAARWPCRLERVLDRPPVIIDVAHNAAGARTLAAELVDAVVVLAVSSDKNARGMIEALRPAAHELILTQFDGTRALPVDALCREAADLPHRRAESLEAALDMALSLASEAHPLVITGSIFTAGQARRILMDRFGAAPIAF